MGEKSKQERCAKRMNSRKKRKARKYSCPLVCRSWLIQNGFSGSMDPDWFVVFRVNKLREARP